MVKKNISVIIQARVNSSRFPKKILSKIQNNTLLEILIKRILKSKKIDDIIIACTRKKEDDKIVEICKNYNVKIFRGSEKNVFDRYYQAAKKFKIKNIIRLTSDCPLIDPRILNKFIEKFFSGGFDYLSNTINPTFPDGMDIEIFKYKIMKEKILKKISNHEKEHVTFGFHNKKKYKIYNFKSDKNLSNLKLTVDTKKDFYLIRNLIEKLDFNYQIPMKKIIDFLNKNKKFSKKYISFNRNEGIKMSLGQKFWRRANSIIPGGSMLFSKNPDLHLPNLWPAYYSRAKGCKIWDLENKVYKDIFLMGVGTNTLGYSFKPLEKKIIETVQRGNMSSLNSVDEILLAEKLIDIHKWADMVRFTRSGGEANSVAIRIARAATGKDNIAVCGYHGWHDWYLSSNLQNKKNLNNHLMKNLNIKGVPKVLKNSVFPFNYNDISQLKKIIKEHEIGTIKMEVERNIPPKLGFLKEVRKICDKNNIVLIFDECTSGFRSCFGGLHLKYKINPDIAIFGKALGNGYAVNAIIGKKEIMESISKTFISSTFWTERIGSIAGLETLKLMENMKSWEIISKNGIKIKKNWMKLANYHSLKINIQGLESLPNFYFESNNHNLYKTYISQEMLKKKILASNVVYSCIDHNDKTLEPYYNILNDIFKKIKKCENGEENISNLLETNEAITGLRGK